MWVGRSLILAVLLALMTTSYAHAQCGTRGGPGYRGPNGQCIGWERFAKTCGTPPETRCSRECPGGVCGEAEGEEVVDLAGEGGADTSGSLGFKSKLGRGRR